MEDILGIDLLKCMQRIYDYFEKESKKRKWNGYACSRYTFTALTKMYNSRIDSSISYDYDEVKNKCIELAKLGFIKLYIDVYEGDVFFFKMADSVKIIETENEDE